MSTISTAELEIVYCIIENSIDNSTFSCAWDKELIVTVENKAWKLTSILAEIDAKNVRI